MPTGEVPREVATATTLRRKLPSNCSPEVRPRDPPSVSASGRTNCDRPPRVSIRRRSGGTTWQLPRAPCTASPDTFPVELGVDGRAWRRRPCDWAPAGLERRSGRAAADDDSGSSILTGGAFDLFLAGPV